MFSAQVSAPELTIKLFLEIIYVFLDGNLPHTTNPPHPTQRKPMVSNSLHKSSTTSNFVDVDLEACVI